MGEICDSDIYHSFRSYPEYMRPWISGLGEGESAFDNEDPLKCPHKIGKDGSIIQNVNKTGDKYKRQVWDKPALSVHTRNDQLASQNTIHLFIISVYQNKATATGLSRYPVAVFFKYSKNTVVNYLSNIDRQNLILYNKPKSTYLSS